MSASGLLLLLVAALCGLRPATPARADEPEVVLELRYTPVARAQVAAWIEDAAGGYLATVALTEAVAYRGIGNRPGASQMNSGYRWPYGRREGVLPIWAHRRAAAPGAKLFPRVVFQSRPEGFGVRVVFDQSPDPYFCLSNQPEASTRDQLDAVSCPSLFMSDKGRYMNEADREADYGEPWQESTAAGPSGSMRALPLYSLYPPRMDAVRCTQGGCFDGEDVDRFAADARAAMPEIDAVTQATAPGDLPQRLLFSVPSVWPEGEYVAFIEVNVEGDYDARWNDVVYPTPQLPENAWDPYVVEYGYPYRGQPSVVYRVEFELGAPAGTRFATDVAAGRSSWDHFGNGFGEIEPISLADDDPAALSAEDGSGVDRLRRDRDGDRFVVQIGAAGHDDDAGVRADAGAGEPGEPAAQDAPGAVAELTASVHPDERRSHSVVVLRFLAPSAPRPIHAYEVRVATAPIFDEASFVRAGRPAKDASEDAAGPAALMLPTDVPAGAPIEAEIGDLAASTHYYIGVRATDDLNRHGPIRFAEVTTTERTFATVTPCFIATAAYGSPLAAEVGALRRLRDRYLLSTAPGRALVAAYRAAGAPAARVIERHPALRAYVRALLAPLVAIAQRLL